jgi:hypothetical protein
MVNLSNQNPMKTKSTIGIILQVAAVLIGIGGAAMVVVILGLDKGSPQAMAFGMGVGLVVALAVVGLLGAAELLHAVMRTAAATEETVEWLRTQGLVSLSGAARTNRASAGPVLSGVSAGGVVGVQGEAAADFEHRVWQPAEESKCEVCNNFFTLPSKRQAEVTCPHCGVSGAWPV